MKRNVLLKIKKVNRKNHKKENTIIEKHAKQKRTCSKNKDEIKSDNRGYMRKHLIREFFESSDP